MKKAGATIFLLSIMCLTHAAEKLFLLAEDGFTDFLKNDFHRLALSVPEKYDSKLSAVPEKDTEPVLMISKKRGSEKYESVSFAVRGNLFFVNDRNPVKDFSPDELKQLLSGTFQRWSRTNVKLRQICYSGPENIMPSKLEKGAVPWVRFTDPAVALQMVAMDVTAVGILPLKDAALKVRGTKMLTVNGVAATPETVMNGSYSGSVRYYLSLRKDAPPEVRKLYEKLNSKQTKLKLMKAGFLPVIEGD